MSSCLKLLNSTISSSVTRLGNSLHFGQLFKACGNNYFAQIAHIFRQFFEGVKNFHFSSEIIFGPLYRHLATFYWSRWSWPEMLLKQFDQVLTFPEEHLLSPPHSLSPHDLFSAFSRQHFWKTILALSRPGNVLHPFAVYLIKLIVNKIADDWFKLWIFGARSDRSTNCTTTTALKPLI